MLYIDTSSFLKLILTEPESPATRQAVHLESIILVSTLTELETSSQLRGAWIGGRLSKSEYSRSVARFQDLLDMHPFRRISLPGNVFDHALSQLHAHLKLHCRSLDRLHLAAMEQLGIDRLMTHDTQQCNAAKALGIQVVTPV